MKPNFLIQNQRALATLTAWLRGGRFPHAILVEGPKGSGRKTFARKVAQALLCSGENPPCEQCAHCDKVARGIHPDLITVQGEGGTRSFYISMVRDIRTQAIVRPNEAKNKVFLLLDTENMGAPAQNALLKILEEPPAGVYFILVCENREQMLPTIQSRTSIVTMEIPDVEHCAEELQRREPEKTPEQCRRAAVQAGGNIGRALELLEDEEAQARQEQALEIFTNILEGRELEALAALAACQRDKPLFLEYLSLFRSFAVDLMLEGKQSHRYSALQLMEIIDILDEISLAVEMNVNMLLLVTLLPSKIRTVLES